MKFNKLKTMFLNFDRKKVAWTIKNIHKIANFPYGYEILINGPKLNLKAKNVSIEL